MKRIIVLSICLALSQIGFAEIEVNPDGTAKVSWGGEQGLNNAKKIMYENNKSLYNTPVNTYKISDIDTSAETDNDSTWKRLTKNAENNPKADNSSKEWILAGQSKIAKIYIYPASLAVDDLHNKTIWSKAIRNQTIKNPNKPNMIKGLLVIDCSTKQIGVNNYTEYDWKGNQIGKEKAFPDFLLPKKSFAPDNVYYTIMENVCETNSQ